MMLILLLTYRHLVWFLQGKKLHFIGYMGDDYKTEPLRIMLPKASTNVKCYDGGTEWI